MYKAEGEYIVNISRRPSEYADENIKADLSKSTEVVKAAKAVKAIGKPLKMLVNCAGVLSMQPFGEITPKELENIMAVNVNAVILLTSELMADIKKDGADVVNIVSTAAYKVGRASAAYGTSKWAIRGFTECVREELTEAKGRVINFSPDVFDSKLYEKAVNETVEDKSRWMRAADLAKYLKQTLDLPGLIEVKEVVIDHNKPAVMK